MVATDKEAAHRAASDAEQIAWVDGEDQLLGAMVRSELRERGLICLLYTSPSPRDQRGSRMPSSA